MKKTFILLFSVLLLGAYAASPLVALLRLKSKVDAGNAAAVEELVDLKRLRTSLSTQIVESYLKLTGKTAGLGDFGNMAAVGIARTLADPIVDRLVNPEVLLDFLQAGVIPGATGGQIALGALSPMSIESLWAAFDASEYHFGKFDVALPPSAPSRERFRVRMQVLQAQWKLTGVDLPERLRTRIAFELAKANS